MQLHGIHHLTAVTANARGNHHFYTEVLGLRLVKKTVNQDDVSAYHLFYADGIGSPGSDITFFDWPAAREQRGTRSVVRTAFRVSGGAALQWWAAYLDALKITHGGVVTQDGRGTLAFEDPEGQRIALVDDGGVGEAHPWAKSPAPPEWQIRGLGPITMSVPTIEKTDRVLREVLNFRPAREYAVAEDVPVTVYEMGPGGAAAELHVAVEPDLPPARLGAGGVHHVAFRTTKADYAGWTRRLEELGVRSSGPIDRFYFQSLYFREPSGVLFELATDEPGFAADEPLETIGEKLALPPFLESRRAEIEAGLKPL